MNAIKNVFPSIITSLPEADIPIDGLEAHLFQGPDQQIVFMSFAKDIDVPAHSHKAQWGVVLTGEIELTIDGVSRIYRKGDRYYIPDGVTHSAVIKSGYSDITLFDQKDRYAHKDC